MPPRALPSTASAIALATSPTKAGWKRVLPPPISGSAGDIVANAITDAVDGKARGGAIYELGGPEVRTFKELMQLLLATIERKRLLVPFPFFLAKLQAMALQFLPVPLLTPDQVDMLRVDNVASEAAKADGRTLQGLGITPELMEAILPAYLWRFRKAGQFHNRTA